ncbi:hypothetical protein B0H13DRAFT_1873559 [Mycena leptocephala]|nr:hypothetical protein B0H13DRAFT_1873559 [Mycena leptocephala]
MAQDPTCRFYAAKNALAPQNLSPIADLGVLDASSQSFEFLGFHADSIPVYFPQKSVPGDELLSSCPDDINTANTGDPRPFYCRKVAGHVYSGSEQASITNDYLEYSASPNSDTRCSRASGYSLIDLYISPPESNQDLLAATLAKRRIFGKIAFDGLVFDIYTPSLNVF